MSATIGVMLQRLFLFFRTAGKLGWGGVMLAIILFGLSIGEHILNHNLEAYFLALLGGLSFSFGAYCAWEIEHQKLLSEIQSHNSNQKAYEITAIDLRAHIHDLQANLLERSQELDRVIDSNRPEVFVSYPKTLIFRLVSPSSFLNREERYVCEDLVQIENSGRNTAYEIVILPVATEAFYLLFDSIPKLKHETTSKVRVVLEPLKLEETSDEHSFHVSNQKDVGIHKFANGSALYEVVETPKGRQIEVGVGLQLKVMWRDSGRHHFCSTSIYDQFSFIERTETPMSNEEMQAAYDHDEVEAESYERDDADR